MCSADDFMINANMRCWLLAKLRQSTSAYEFSHQSCASVQCANSGEKQLTVQVLHRQKHLTQQNVNNVVLNM